MNSILNKSVYTPHGKAVVVFEYKDGTVAVKFEGTGGGMILHTSQVFVRPDVVTSSRAYATRSKSLLSGERSLGSMVA